MSTLQSTACSLNAVFSDDTMAGGQKNVVATVDVPWVSLERQIKLLFLSTYY